MSNVVDKAAVDKRDDNSLLIRKLNGERFMWHQKLLANRSLTLAAKCFAGAVMHKYRVDTGYAALSSREATKMTGLSKNGAMDARDQLIEHGWLVRLGAGCGPLEKARYALRVPMVHRVTHHGARSDPHPTGDNRSINLISEIQENSVSVPQ